MHADKAPLRRGEMLLIGLWEEDVLAAGIRLIQAQACYAPCRLCEEIQFGLPWRPTL